MSKFIIKEDFLEIFPDATIGILLAKGINNSEPTNSEILNYLAEANKNCKKYLNAEVFSENPAVSVWRKAYQNFKTKKGARCSIEAMLKRVHGGSNIPSINPLVDLYNIISLNYGIPCGGEDIDTFEGDMILTKAEGNEYFVPLGSVSNEPPYPEEIVYKDDVGAICRCWNWREAQRTMLTENTKNAFLIIEYMDESREEDIKNALADMEKAVLKYLGGKTETFLMNKDFKEIVLA